MGCAYFPFVGKLRRGTEEVSCAPDDVDAALGLTGWQPWVPSHGASGGSESSRGWGVSRTARGTPSLLEAILFSPGTEVLFL